MFTGVSYFIADINYNQQFNKFKIKYKDFYEILK